MKNFAPLAIVLLLLIVPMTTHAQDWPNAEIEPLSTELVMELKVDIGAPQAIGASDKGTRRFIPITGGSFVGKGIKGEVIPGGADWQLVRPDGVTEIKAIYAIKTDDGQVIAVDNRGIVAPAGDGVPPYTRTTPKFQAPQGDYEWLNQRVFVGTITPSLQEGFVTIRVFQVN